MVTKSKPEEQAATQRATLRLWTLIAGPVLDLAAILSLPNFFVWWDPATKADRPGPDYAYPGFATTAVGGLMRLGAGRPGGRRQATGCLARGGSEQRGGHSGQQCRLGRHRAQVAAPGKRRRDL
mgnify:CR=1 FL=1